MQNECDAQRGEVKQLLEKGEKMKKDTHDDAISVDLGDKLDKLKQDWTKVCDDVANRSARIKEANKCADAFYSELDKTLIWLKLSKDKLTVRPTASLDRLSVGRQLVDAQIQQADVDKKSRDKDELKSKATALISATDIDHPVVTDLLDDTSVQWAALADGKKY